MLLRRLAIMLLLSTAAAAQAISATTPTPAKPDDAHVAMSPEQWETTGQVTFATPSDIHGGALEIASQGSARLRGADFADGVLEFDVKPKNGGIEGVKFHVVGRETADAFYFRAQPRCDTADDCIQYMPYHHGAYEWDLYPEHQTRAPLRADAWNHVKLVISGRQLSAYVNGGLSPTLAVGRLEGGARSGGITLSGPASYANLKLMAGVSGDLPRAPVPDPTAHDQNFVRSWEASGPVTIPTVLDPEYKVPTGVAPKLAQMPPNSAAWAPIQAEDKGLINLSRAYGSSSDGAVVSMVWLKTSMFSDRRQVKLVSMGWLREAWVFVNGRQVFADRNLYGTGASKGPDGSISLSNGSFALPLQKGENTVVVALDDNFSGGQHFGWGMQFHLADIAGVQFPTGAKSSK